MNWRSADSVCPPSGIAPLAQHSRCRCPLTRPGMTMLPRIDARMEYARPALLDAAGRHFHELRLTIAHCGLPWVDEALFMLTKHPNFFAELSYYIATVTPEELFRFLVHAE